MPVSLMITQSVAATTNTMMITRKITRVCGHDASAAALAADLATFLASSLLRTIYFAPAVQPFDNADHGPFVS